MRVDITRKRIGFAINNGVFEYLAKVTVTTGFWSNTPYYMALFIRNKGDKVSLCQYNHVTEEEKQKEKSQKIQSDTFTKVLSNTDLMVCYYVLRHVDHVLCTFRARI